MLKVNYVKRKNAKLFSDFNDVNKIDLTNVHNYNPLYARFFSLNNTNFNSINLNHKWYLHEIFENKSDNSENKSDNSEYKSDNSENKSDNSVDYLLTNIYNCCLKNSVTERKKNKDVFFKIAPLINPCYYLIGKINHQKEDLFQLPFLSNDEMPDNEVYTKMNNPNNSSYIDGFFTFLSSRLGEHYNFPNSIEFYGAFNGIKNNYKLNIFDDLEMLEDSDFFLKNHKKLYNIEYFDDFFDGTHTKKTIKRVNNITPLSIESFEDIIIENDNDNNDEVETSNIKLVNLNDLKSLSIDINDYNFNDSKKSLSDDYSNSCSSHSEETSESNKDDISTEEMTTNTNTDSNTSYSSMSEEYIIANIFKFPVHVICMESCICTFNHFIMNNEMTTEEWYASLMQIIMILLIYQKAFNFTHNDLHTNNIMFNYTETKYIYYIYNGNTYKVPTFGKIFKIIDFGRSIYTFDKKIFCSDSYEKDGDAYEQYNCEPYLNHNKPRIEPNMSFDLCRLGCSLFDYLIHDICETTKLLNETNIKSLNYVKKLIIEWCLDDKGTNVLYKSNGRERYLGFKLYKMITRCVHNHTPEAQLDRDCFKQYIFKGKVKSKTLITNIDEIPCMS